MDDGVTGYRLIAERDIAKFILVGFGVVPVAAGGDCTVVVGLVGPGFRGGEISHFSQGLEEVDRVVELRASGDSGLEGKI